MKYIVKTYDIGIFLTKLVSAKGTFENYSYTNFKRSYIYNSTIPELVKMSDDLEKLYLDVLLDYKNLIAWLTDYLEDVKNFEKTLGTGTNLINNIDTRSYVNDIIKNSKVNIKNVTRNSILINKNKVSNYKQTTAYANSQMAAAYATAMNKKSNYEENNSNNKYSHPLSPDNSKPNTSDNSLTSVAYANRQMAELQNQAREHKEKNMALKYRQKEINKIIEEYDENTAMMYLTMKSFEERSNELKKLIKEKNLAISELEKQKVKPPNVASYNDARALKSFKFTDEEIKKNAEIQAQIDSIVAEKKPLENELLEINFYLSEATNAYEKAKWLSIMSSEDFKKFYDDFMHDRYKESGIEINHVYDVQYMSSDERWVYYYYTYYEKNKEKTEEFYKLIENDINKAKGAEMAAKWIEEYEQYGYDEDHPFESVLGFAVQGGKVVGKGTLDGIDSFFDGMKNVVDWNDKVTADDYAKMIIAQYIIDEDIYDGAYKFSSAFGNMLPSITTSVIISALASTAVGAKVGSVLMGLSAGGNAMHEGLVNGNSTASSFLYGVFTGASEGLVGYFLGKMPFLSKGKEFASLGTHEVGKVAGKELAKNYIKDLFKEGFEELTQEVVDVVFKKICLGEEINFDELPENMRDSFCMGVLMSFVLGGGTSRAKVIINGAVYGVDVDALAAKLYDSNGNINKNLTKNDIKNLIINISKNDNTNYTVTDLSNLKVEYDSLIKEIGLNNYNNYINNPNSIYSSEFINNCNRITELQNIFKENNIIYNGFYSNNIVEMKPANNNAFSNSFSDFLNNNAGYVDFGAIGNVFKNLFTKKSNSNSNNNKTSEKAKFTEAEVKVKLNRYNEIISEFKNNSDYKYWIEEIEKGHTISPSQEFINLRIEISQLEHDLQNAQTYGFKVDKDGMKIKYTKEYINSLYESGDFSKIREILNECGLESESIDATFSYKDYKENFIQFVLDSIEYYNEQVEYDNFIPVDLNTEYKKYKKNRKMTESEEKGLRTWKKSEDSFIKSIDGKISEEAYNELVKFYEENKEDYFIGIHRTANTVDNIFEDGLIVRSAVELSSHVQKMDNFALLLHELSALGSYKMSEGAFIFKIPKELAVDGNNSIFIEKNGNRYIDPKYIEMYVPVKQTKVLPPIENPYHKNNENNNNPNNYNFSNTTTNFGFPGTFSNFLNNNSGYVNLDAVDELPRKLKNYGKKLFSSMINVLRNNDGCIDLRNTVHSIKSLGVHDLNKSIDIIKDNFKKFEEKLKIIYDDEDADRIKIYEYLVMNNGKIDYSLIENVARSELYKKISLMSIYCTEYIHRDGYTSLYSENFKIKSGLKYEDFVKEFSKLKDYPGVRYSDKYEATIASNLSSEWLYFNTYKGHHDMNHENVRMYIPISNESLFQFTELFLNEILKENIEVNFKINNFVYSREERSDSFLIYADRDKMSDYVRIINKILGENNNIKINEKYIQYYAFPYTENLYLAPYLDDSFNSYNFIVSNFLLDLKKESDTFEQYYENCEKIFVGIMKKFMKIKDIEGYLGKMNNNTNYMEEKINNNVDSLENDINHIEYELNKNKGLKELFGKEYDELNKHFEKFYYLYDEFGDYSEVEYNKLSKDTKSLLSKINYHK